LSGGIGGWFRTAMIVLSLAITITIPFAVILVLQDARKIWLEASSRYEQRVTSCMIVLICLMPYIFLTMLIGDPRISLAEHRNEAFIGLHIGLAVAIVLAVFIWWRSRGKGPFGASHI